MYMQWFPTPEIDFLSLEYYNVCAYRIVLVYVSFPPPKEPAINNYMYVSIPGNY